MSDLTPRVENRVSLGNIITILTGIVALIAAGATLQADIRALAQRVDKGEQRDEETSKTLGTVKESIIELKGDNKAIKSDIERQGRQLDRIEQLIRNVPPNPPPPRIP